MTNPMMMLVALIGAHALADFAGQGDFMSKAKNGTAPIPGVQWQTVLTAHAAIHGAAVAIITGIWWLAIPEVIAHWLIDNAKCRGRLTFNQDQILHIGCKVVWWCIAVELLP